MNQVGYRSEQFNFVAQRPWNESSDPYASNYNLNWGQPDFLWAQRSYDGGSSFNQVQSHDFEPYPYSDPQYNSPFPPLDCQQEGEIRLTSLEKSVEELVEANIHTSINITANTHAIARVETQLGELINVIKEREERNFLAQHGNSPDQSCIVQLMPEVEIQA